MIHGPSSEPMRRHTRFNFDLFDSDITKGLKEASEIVEHSIGHMVLSGEIQADEALLYLGAYEKNVAPSVE